MSALSRIKNWITLEILTADDLNAEFNNIVDNIESGADVTDATNVNAAGAVMESDYNAATFLYAVSDNTPIVKTRAEVLTLLSGQAAADFAMNTHKITGVVDPTTDQDAATKKFVDDKIKAPGEIGGTTAAKINCTTLDLDGGQIAFPATAVPHAGANILDDYEEGVYTPTLTCLTSGGYNLDANVNSLAYTKIGGLVTVHGQIGITSADSPNGNIVLSLPFTPKTLDKQADNPLSSICIMNHGGSLVAPLGMIYGGAYQFYKCTLGGVVTAITNTDVDTAFEIGLSFSYLTSL